MQPVPSAHTICRPGEEEEEDGKGQQQIVALANKTSPPSCSPGGILEVQNFLPWNGTSESGCPKPQSFSDIYGVGVGKREDKNYLEFFRSAFVTLQSVGHYDVDFFCFLGKKSGGRIASRDGLAADGREHWNRDGNGVNRWRRFLPGFLQNSC